jgi:hypothetical protein
LATTIVNVFVERVKRIVGMVGLLDQMMRIRLFPRPQLKNRPRDIPSADAEDLDLRTLQEHNP